MDVSGNSISREPWNKGKIVGQKAPINHWDIWALRVSLQMQSRVRELALLNPGIDSKLRRCNLVALKVQDVFHGDQLATCAIELQHKIQRPVQFEFTQETQWRLTVVDWVVRLDGGGLGHHLPYHGAATSCDGVRA